jgi:glycosyltransferase involved in cell wall biosynthesis
MRFSIIIQSYLGAYDGAAKDRETKILRAIDSCLKQTFKDFEIIVVADGCQKTFDIISSNYSNEDKVDCFLIPKQKLWSGHARNFGVTKAKGDYIAYLDIDDTLGENHLQKISDQLEKEDWVWFNDKLVTGQERNCFIDKKFQNGTSNICHKRNLSVLWNGNGYGYDDWSIVNSLKKYPKNKKIETPEYIVHHLPRRLDL